MIPLFLVQGPLFCRHFLSLFYSRSLEHLVEETSGYATRLGVVGWLNTSIVKLEVFVGVIIIKGILKLPTVSCVGVGISLFRSS